MSITPDSITIGTTTSNYRNDNDLSMITTTFASSIVQGIVQQIVDNATQEQTLDLIRGLFAPMLANLPEGGQSDVIRKAIENSISNDAVSSMYNLANFHVDLNRSTGDSTYYPYDSSSYEENK